MGVYFNDKKLVIRAESRSIRFNLKNKVDNRLKHETDSIIRHNKNLAEPRIKNKINQLFYKYMHGNGIQKHGK